MKKLLLLTLMISFVALSFAQEWEIVKEGKLGYSPNDGPNAGVFIDADNGWLVGDEGRVQNTTDGGINWSTLREPDGGEDWKAVDFVDANIGYACAGEGEIYKTTDGGVNWILVSDTLYTDDLKALDAVTSEIVFVAGKDGCLLKTTDGGTNFVKSDSTFLGEDLDGGIAFCDENVGVVISDGNGGHTWYTHDGGDSWNYVNVAGIFPLGTASSRIYDVGAVGDSTILITGYNYVNLLSTDGGLTYTLIGDYAFGYVRNELVDLVDENTFFIAGDYLVRTTDAGITFDTLKTGSAQSFEVIDFIDENTGFVFQGNGQWLKTTDGETFTPLLEWPNLGFRGLATPADDKIVLSAWGGGEISISEDGGETFSYPNNLASKSTGSIFECEFFDANNGVIAGQSGYTAITEDGGISWLSVDNSTNEINALEYANESLVFSGGKSGYVSKSEDGGTTWKELTNEGEEKILDIWAFSSEDIVAFCEDAQVCGMFGDDTSFSVAMTLDHGEDINAAEYIGDIGLFVCDKGIVMRENEGVDTVVTVFTEPDGDDFYDIEFVNGTEVYIAGEKGKIYKSIDAGINWTVEICPVEETIQKLSYRNGKLWAASQNGFILCRDIEIPVEPVDITFNVDMSVQINNGAFVAGTDFVDIAGSFTSWADNPVTLDDTDSDSIYTTTITDFIPGETIQYKFRINGDWDTSEFPNGGPNREYIVPDSNSIVDHLYNDEEAPEGIIEENNLPTEYALRQNYPNPFNPVTNISFDLPKASNVKLVVFNIQGQIVTEVKNDFMRAGRYNVKLDGSQFSSGIYIYKINAGNFVSIKKMTLLK